jgi:polyphosphate kinase 2 (PPK2 family)
MKGAAKAAARRADENTVQAYQVLNFYGLAMSKKLKPLSEYLHDKPKRRQQTTDEMLAVFKGFAASGKPMNIRQVN